MAAETAQRMVEQQGAASESVAQHSQDAQAAEMLAEEENSESEVSKAAEEGQGNDLGESQGVEDDEDPPAPWEQDEKEARKAAETRKEEAKIEAVMNEVDHPERAAPPQRAVPQPQQQDDHPDLGESAGVAAHAAVQNDANALTNRAQAQTSAENVKVEKVKAIHRAKAIADKVRKLVENQKKLEGVAGQKVPGSILGEAEDQKAKADALSRQDTVLAHKLEDQQAQSTMEHLINTERTRQASMFKKETTQTHNLLASVRSKLKAEQAKMTSYVKTETMAAVKQVEGTLSQTNVAKKVEDVVKKKLAKRLQELQKTAEKTISGVATQVAALKSRVRRLRREQTRMKVAEAQQQTHQSHRDLGESAGVGNSAMEMQMERMKMEQNMMQQQMMMQQRMQQPQMMQQPPPVNTAEHEEFLMMKRQMSEMRKQNQLLSQLVQKQHTSRLHKLAKADQPQYTHSGLSKYFQNKHLNAAMLKKDVLAEQTRLKEATAEEEELETTSLLQLSEGSHDPATATAMPLYNQRAEQARVESEELIRRAQADALAMEQGSDE